LWPFAPYTTIVTPQRLVSNTFMNLWLIPVDQENAIDCKFHRLNILVNGFEIHVLSWQSILFHLKIITYSTEKLSGGYQNLANHESALKRARQSETRRLKNIGYKTRVKHAVKEVRTAIVNNSTDQAKENLTKAVSIIQKTSSKGIIHKRKASRKISRLTRQVNRLSAS
jgi:small subunit ribosomal protein S20